MSVAADPPLLQIVDVRKNFGGVAALSGVSFDVRPGELHAIVGENGAGKSTLMKILSGVITEYDGEIRLHGQPTRFGDARAAESAGVAIIHQELLLVEQLSVAANLFLGRERAGFAGWLRESEMHAEAARVLTLLRCNIPPDRPVGSLRIGDQQLVEIAKALLRDSRILIMDEPTSALTEGEVERLMNVIADLRARGVTILYISHKMEEVFRLADRVTVLRDGRWIATLDRAEATPQKVVHLMVGRELEGAVRTAQPALGEPVLQVRGLSLPWPGHARRWRLEDVSLTLHRGEILGIAGLMGAGRTELLECLFGASEQRPQGEILLAGRRVAFSHPGDACAAGIALVTEDRKRLGLFPQFGVRENITLCRLQQLSAGGLVLSGKERAAAAQQAADLRVKAASLESPILSLSGGNQQKAIIGRWLLTLPTVLLLDDPTRGIDVGAKAEIHRLMDQLCRQGLSIIVTSSELPELLAVSDRILVLSEGRLTGEFTRAEATEQSIMEAATAAGRRPAEQGAIAS